MSQLLSKYEKLIAELTWGGIPLDVEFVKNSNLFKQKHKEVEQKAIKIRNENFDSMIYNETLKLK